MPTQRTTRAVQRDRSEEDVSWFRLLLIRCAMMITVSGIILRGITVIRRPTEIP
jgi:hypothetical protein